MQQISRLSSIKSALFEIPNEQDQIPVIKNNKLIYFCSCALKTRFYFVRPISMKYPRWNVLLRNVALLTIKQHVLENLENILFTLGIFISLSKAFDLLNLCILSDKLLLAGIRVNLSRCWNSIRTTENNSCSLSVTNLLTYRSYMAYPKEAYLSRFYLLCTLMTSWILMPP